jgi:hypothetical protein
MKVYLHLAICILLVDTFTSLMGGLHLRFGCAFHRRRRFRCDFQCRKLKNDIKTHATEKRTPKLHIQNASVIDPEAFCLNARSIKHIPCHRCQSGRSHHFICRPLLSYASSPCMNERIVNPIFNHRAPHALNSFTWKKRKAGESENFMSQSQFQSAAEQSSKMNVSTNHISSALN